MRIEKTVATLVLTLALGIAGALTMAPSASAERAATEKRGFNAQGAFAVAGLDSVSLFTGSLIVTVPVGPTFTVSPTLSYGLNAVYSSTGGWDPVPCPEGSFMPDPDPLSTGGFAWSIQLGQVSQDPSNFQWRYDSPDGGRHGMYSRLHPNYPATAQANTYYTNDGTHLRMKYQATGASCTSAALADSECVTIESPDGLVQEFRRVRAGDEVYRLTRIEDPFGHFLAVSYTASFWTLTDSLGRVQSLRFGGDLWAYNRVNQVQLTAFAGGTATYTLSYTNQGIVRRDFIPASCSLDNDEYVNVFLLDKVKMPDNSYYDFDYYTTNSAPEFLPGGLKSLRAPTGAEYSWEYSKESYTSQDPHGDRFGRDTTTIYPVVKKEIALSVGATAHGTWTYDYKRGAEKVPGENSIPCHRATTVTDPEGNDSVSYFSTTNTPKHSWAYGLPYTYCQPGGVYSATGPFLSTEVYEGSAATGTKLRSVFVEYTSDGFGMGGGKYNQEKNSRLTYRKTVYHDDSDFYSETTLSDYDGMGNFRNQVVTGNFTAQDFRSTVVDMNSTLGTLVVNPETSSATGSTFSLPGLSAAWRFTTFTTKEVTTGTGNSAETAKAEFCFDADTGYLSRTRVLAGNAPAAKDLLTVFVPQLDDGEATGFVASELRYGGDNQGSMDNVYTTLCNMTLPAQAKYQTDHTYSNGVLATSTVIDSCGGDLLSLVDQTIDPNTGLVASSRDAAGVQVVYKYDSQGRLTSERPAESAWSDYTYQLPTEASPGLLVQVVVKDCANGVIGCNSANALTWRRLDYDGLGRLEKERIRVPEASGLIEKVRTSTYNALGWKLTQSVWGNNSLVTTFEDHDPFGRVGKITPPGQQSTVLTYEGERVMTRQTWVMTASNAEEEVYTTEIHDIHGRLIRICENESQAWSGTCTGIETGYIHDVGSRLNRVCSKRSVNAQNVTTCGQTRFFEYDNRGFLTRERHPEIGITEATAFPLRAPETATEKDVGNDWIDYTYDVLGNVLTKDIQGSSEFDLEYDYDEAGRLIRLEETNSGSPRLLKEFFYAKSNVGDDLRAGKLVQTRRHNWVDIITPLPPRNPGSLDAVISEVFKYEGLDGRVSARQTRYNFNGATYAFNLSQTYTELGNVETLTYPQCLHAQGNCSSAAPARTVSYEYNKGFLTKVPAYADKISYQAGGMLHQIEHANGVTYTIEIDSATGLERPYRIKTTATPAWNTGIYTYDGSGNIASIGAQKYRYDGLSRLVSGQVLVGSSLKTQTVAYDDFGNITKLTTDGSVQLTPTDTTSNRMTGPLAKYDGAGNVTELDYGTERYEYEYDGVNMMKHLRSDTDLARIYLYNADDERIAQFDCATGVCETKEASETWTVRGLHGRVLRTYLHPWNQGWLWKGDYIFGGAYAISSSLPTAGNSESINHIHVDHLGSLRQTTANNGSQLTLHSYAPFGQESTESGQGDLAMKFTGHERDNSESNSNGTLDYMRARYCNPTLGRFQSVDINVGNPLTPKSFNRYAYALNSPVRYVDPNGETAVDAAGGFFNALTSNFLLGAGRREAVNEDFAKGQAAGDAAAFVLALLETGQGMQAAIGGGACVITTGGTCAPIGAPAAIGGALVASHGVLVANTAAANLTENSSQMSSQSGRSGGREGRGRGANKRDRKQVDAAAKQAGVEDRKGFGKFIEAIKKGLERGGAENFTFEELLELAEEFKQM